MEKPISLIIDETKSSIADVINSSRLHPYILDTIMNDLYQEVHRIMLLQADKDKQNYENALRAESQNIETEVIEANTEEPAEK